MDPDRTKNTLERYLSNQRPVHEVIEISDDEMEEYVVHQGIGGVSGSREGAIQKHDGTNRIDNSHIFMLDTSKSSILSGHEEHNSAASESTLKNTSLLMLRKFQNSNHKITIPLAPASQMKDDNSIVSFDDSRKTQPKALLLHDQTTDSTLPSRAHQTLRKIENLNNEVSILSVPISRIHNDNDDLKDSNNSSKNMQTEALLVHDQASESILQSSALQKLRKFQNSNLEVTIPSAKVNSTCNDAIDYDAARQQFTYQQSKDSFQEMIQSSSINHASNIMPRYKSEARDSHKDIGNHSRTQDSDQDIYQSTNPSSQTGFLNSTSQAPSKSLNLNKTSNSQESSRTNSIQDAQSRSRYSQISNPSSRKETQNNKANKDMDEVKRHSPIKRKSLKATYIIEDSDEEIELIQSDAKRSNMRSTKQNTKANSKSKRTYKKDSDSDCVPVDDKSPEVSGTSSGDEVQIIKYIEKETTNLQPANVMHPAKEEDDFEVVKTIQAPKIAALCYGMINAYLHGPTPDVFHFNPETIPADLKCGTWFLLKFKVKATHEHGPSKSFLTVVCYFYHQNDLYIGHLDPFLSRIFCALRNISMHIWIDLSPIPPVVPEPFRLKIFISGYDNTAKQIGQYFMDNNVFLLQPDLNIRLYPYKNPQIRTEFRSQQTVNVARGQIEAIYSSLLDSSNLPETEPDKRLVSTLFKHQKQALSFMLSREETLDFTKSNPMSFYTRFGNTYKNIITDVKISNPFQIRGGIIADDMGVGKTIQCIALILSSQIKAPLVPPPPQSPPSPPRFAFGFVPPPPEEVPRDLVGSISTLIVCPLSTISNWEDQITTHTIPDSLKVYVHHGSTRTTSSAKIAKYDVVITTYSILAINMKQKNGLFGIYWNRVILDEAHCIKTPSTIQAKAAFALQARSRWCLTGTPIQNKLDDLFSLCRFLHVHSLQTKHEWSKSISKPMRNDTHYSISMGRLQNLMKLISLRRMKDQKVDGKPILDLPTRDERIVILQLPEKERIFYDSVRDRARFFFDGLVKTGTVLKNYAHVLQAILRMRQAATHRGLIKDRDGLDDIVTPVEVMGVLRESGEDLCMQCGTDSLHCQICLSPCQHPICMDCIEKEDSLEIQCSICQQMFNPANVTSSINQEEEEEDDDLQYISSLPTNNTCIKIQTLIQDLMRVRQKEPEVKTTMLRLVEVSVIKAGFGIVRLDGTMTRQARFEAMNRFKTDDTVHLFLISLKSGGVGLNLTRASRVYLMEPYWNPAVESQAIDRVHRLGQTRPVVATRFIVENSIEENMLKLQEQKTDMAKEAFREGKGKGVSKTEKAKERMMSLKMLFL